MGYRFDHFFKFFFLRFRKVTDFGRFILVAVSGQTGADGLWQMLKLSLGFLAFVANRT